MFKLHRQAFTMIELIFVVVIIGILSAVAIPKFAATRDDAIISTGINTLASVRNAIATERQKRILRGDFTAISNLSAGGGVFDTFDTTGNDVLAYPPNKAWTGSGNSYTFTYNGGSCDFSLTSNKLTGTCAVFGN